MPRKKATVMSEGDALEHARRVSQSMTPIGGISLKVKCKNPRQKELLKAIREHDITLVSGPAGTGKSYVSIYAALDWLKSNPETCKKIIFIYPTEEDDGESLGFLPGTSEEKLQPWSAPDMYTIEKILRESGKEEQAKGIVEDLLKKGIVEIHPTLWLRGLTIDNAFVIVSECQNLGKDSLLKVLTRIGENCKIVVSGDLKQISAKGIKRGKRESGLGYALSVLPDLAEVASVEFKVEDIVRNPLISKLLLAWDPESYGYLEDAPGVKKD